MSRKSGSRASGMVLAAAVAAICFARAAEASVITYDFTVDVTSGPLSGTVENGSFSYNSSSITPPVNSATGLLTALDFTFNGTTYDASTANTGDLDFNAAGDLTGFLFGTNCSADTCVVTAGTNEWLASNGNSGFAYSRTGFDDFGFGNVTFALAVPEPDSVALLATALVCLGFAGFLGRRYSY